MRGYPEAEVTLQGRGMRRRSILHHGRMRRAACKVGATSAVRGGRIPYPGVSLLPFVVLLLVGLSSRGNGGGAHAAMTVASSLTAPTLVDAGAIDAHG